MNDHWAVAAIRKLGTLHIDHPSYKSSLLEIKCASIACSIGEVIVVIGPPRVGKTRLLAESIGAVLDAEPDANGHMAAVYLEAGNDSTAGSFSTKDFYFEGLGAIRHPSYRLPQKTKGHEKLERTQIPEWAIQRAFRISLYHRKTQFFVVDEAHHVRYAPRQREAATRILDGLKSLANRSRCTLVLCGSYSLLDLLVMSPHFCGRTHLIEVPRYRDNQDDMGAFAGVLKHLGQHLRFKPGEDLVKWGTFLFEGSLGCIGSLMLWVRGALGKALVTRSDTLNIEHFEASFQPKTMREAIKKEIVDGETTINRARLLLKSDPTIQPNEVVEEVEEKSRNKHVAPSSPKEAANKRRRKPFQRKTRRNPLDGRA